LEQWDEKASIDLSLPNESNKNYPQTLYLNFQLKMLEWEQRWISIRLKARNLSLQSLPQRHETNF